MRDAIIRLKGVSKIYGVGEAATHAVADASLTVERNSWLAIMGPSGHGKSTLLQLMGGLDRPSTGDVFIDGAELSALSSGEVARVRAQRIGFVFQFFNLMPHLTAVENIELALWLGGREKTRRRERALDLLKHVGLSHKADHSPAMLSGGQQQRVAIARALANDPEVLLMDEPTGNLDSASEAELLALLDRLHAEGKTLVMVTHNATVAGRAQRIVRVKDGRIEKAHASA